MRWLESMRLVPLYRVDVTRVYIFNAIAAPALWVLFWFSSMPTWALTACAVFVGAAWHNTAAGIVMGRIVRDIERDSEQAEL